MVRVHGDGGERGMGCLGITQVSLKVGRLKVGLLKNRSILLFRGFRGFRPVFQVFRGRGRSGRVREPIFMPRNRFFIIKSSFENFDFL